MSAQQDAALRGASLAFQNQKPKKLSPGDPSSHPPSTPKNNGALLAATSASRDHSVASASRETSPPRISRANSARPTPQRTTTTTISRQTTGGSSVVQDWGARSPDQQTAASAAAQRLSQFLSSPSSATATSPYLLPPAGGRPSVDTRSASFIAATLAASRSASPSPSPNNLASSPGYNVGHNRPVSYRERRGSIGASSVASSTASLDLPDTSNIAPTTSLISMFEDKRADTKPSKRKDGSPGRGLGPTPKLRPPTPERELSPKREDSKPEPKKAAPKPKPKPKAKPRAVTPPPQIVRRAATEIVSPEPRRIEQRLKLPPPSPPPTKSATVSQKPGIDKTGDGQGDPASKPAPIVKASKPRVAPLVLSSTTLGKPRQDPNGPAPRPTTAKSASSDDTFVSASSMQSPRSPSIRSFQDLPLPQTDRGAARPATKPKPLGRPSTPKAVSRPTTPKLRRPPSVKMPSNSSPTRQAFQQQNPDSALTLDSLTSAIVAGNLASARHTPNPLSRTPPPIPAPRHRHKKISPHHSGRQGMRQTLRQPASKSDDEDARRRKRALEGRKKHTHHEGTRRRWRDEIYEREKKRYEAVWASNRGLFLVPHPAHPSHFQLIELPPTTLREGEDLSEHVANVVVRDIWSRSRLPEDELAEVWDLVDRGRKGMLNKQEFVVGMWLIDQRLRGRKIPARVSNSVWDSVKGVRVPGPGIKGK